ncbi:MAG: alpha/beta fold hydrolase, partial [Dehalococcoidia bacterium]|nr:alpha/beta fold hydrolase [Dehalococcoidia bacterium]
PGFGDSDPLGGEFDYSAFVAFVDQFAGGVGLTRFNLVGHSIGGCIALQYALERPDRVIKLVLVSSLGIGKSIGRWIKYLSTPVFMYLVGEPMLAFMDIVKWVSRKLSRPMQLKNNPLTRMNIGLGRKIATLAGQTLVLRERLCELVVPTLVVWGSHDGIVPVRHAYVAAELIPDCRIQVLDGGHSIHRQRMAEFSDALNDFLE